MKKILILIVLLAPMYCFCQDFNLPLKFTVNEEAEAWIGKQWDFSYEPMKTPMNVSFNGKILKMTYTNGKVFSNDIILDYKKLESKEYDKINGITYILKVEKNGYIDYIVIEKDFNLFGSSITVNIPFRADNGTIMAYYRYNTITD